MSNIKMIIDGLAFSGYDIIRMDMSINKAQVKFSEKKYIKSVKAKSGGLKDYVALLKEATIDGIKPTIREHYSKVGKAIESGIIIQSTEVTFWLLRPTEDWSKIYVDHKAGYSSDSGFEFSTDFIPHKGYRIMWSQSNVWHIFGWNHRDHQVLVASESQVRAIGVEFESKGQWDVDSFVSFSDSEATDQDIDVTDGTYEGNKVLNMDQAVFTSLGEVFALGSFSSKH